MVSCFSKIARGIDCVVGGGGVGDTGGSSLTGGCGDGEDTDFKEGERGERMVMGLFPFLLSFGSLFVRAMSCLCGGSGLSKFSKFRFYLCFL